eukprot:3728837-Ditylum_brightwellii.AAC.1
MGGTQKDDALEGAIMSGEFEVETSIGTGDKYSMTKENTWMHCCLPKLEDGHCKFLTIRNCSLVLPGYKNMKKDIFNVSRCLDS